MLWYKSWLETRWRFLIGFAILFVMACGHVLQYPAVLRLMPLADAVGRVSDSGGLIGRAIRTAIDTERTFRGYIWWEWYRQNLPQLGTLFAVLIGNGGLLAGGAGSLFTLSLPVTRGRLLGARALTGLAEILAIALIPSLLPPLLAPAIGQQYSLVEALVHAACAFIGATVFFSLATLLSTVFADVWRPAMLACGAAIAIAGCEAVLADGSRFGIFGAMTAESYFRSGTLPWPGLIVSVAASAAMLYAAGLNINHVEV